MVDELRWNNLFKKSLQKLQPLTSAKPEVWLSFTPAGTIIHSSAYSFSSLSLCDDQHDEPFFYVHPLLCLCSSLLQQWITGMGFQTFFQLQHKNIKQHYKQISAADNCLKLKLFNLNFILWKENKSLRDKSDEQGVVVMSIVLMWQKNPLLHLQCVVWYVKHDFTYHSSGGL